MDKIINNINGSGIFIQIGAGAGDLDTRANCRDGFTEFIKKLPRNIDLLKMDCEGAEYYLLADNQFLSHLQPKEIQMEYHNGANIILRYLKDSGYKAHVSSGSKTAGIIKAYRIHNFS